MFSRIKQFILLGLLSLLLLSSVGQVAAAAPGLDVEKSEAAWYYESTGTVKSQYLNVRSGPGTQYAKVTTIYYGQVLTLLNRTHDSSWLRVRLGNGQLGWVYASYVAAPWRVVANLPILSSAPPQPWPPVPVESVGTVTSSGLNVRSGPSFNHNVVGWLSQGNRVALIGRDSGNKWLNVRWAGYKKGWVSARFIYTRTPIWQLPITEVTIPEPPPSFVGHVTSPNLNVRSGPGFNYRVFDRLYHGQPITIYGRDVSGRWFKIGLSNGGSGWVSARYVRVDFPVYQLKTLDT